MLNHNGKILELQPTSLYLVLACASSETFPSWDLTVIYCDNQNFVKLSKNPMFHDKLKHIEIKDYFLYDKVQRGEVVLQYISIDEQITDILVKPLSKMKSLHT